MIASRLLPIGFAFAMVVASGAAAQPATGNPRCVYPDPYVLLGRDFAGLEKVDYRFIDTKAGQLRWVFLSWAGPKGGTVFVLSCDGHVVAEHGLGYAEELEFGPLPDPWTIDVKYTDATGTGLLERSESFLQFDGKTIAVLWDHKILDRSTFPNFMWTGRQDDDRSRTDTYTYQWTYSQPRNEIRVTGTHKVELDPGPRKHKAGSDPSVVHSSALPEEKYCFKSEANRFVRC